MHRCAHVREAEEQQARVCVCLSSVCLCTQTLKEGALELSEWQACSRQWEVCERRQVCGSLGKRLLLVGTVISAHWLGAKLGNQRNSWKRLQGHVLLKMSFSSKLAQARALFPSLGWC